MFWLWKKAPKPRAPPQTCCFAAKAGTQGYKWSRIKSHFHSCLPVNVSHSGEECVALHRHYACGQRWPVPDPSLTNEFPLISSEPSEPCHKKPCYRVGLIFWAGFLPTVPPSSILLLDFWPAVFVTMAALFVFEQVVLTLYHCVYYTCVFYLSLFLFLSQSICWLEYWCCQFLPCNNFPLVLFCFPVSFLLFFHPVSLNLALFFSLYLFFLVWPGPGHPYPQCMYYYLSFFFISLHDSNIVLPLAVFHHSSCMRMLTQVITFLLSGEIQFCPILIIIWLSRVCFVLLTLHSQSW